MEYIFYALLAGVGTYLMNAAGSALVFFFKSVRQQVLNAMMGFASGIMIAASFWSLLAPAIEMADGFILPVAGFLAGGAFLYAADKLLPHLHSMDSGKPEGIHTSWKRNILLITAMTLHNVPEGLAIGITFGVAATGTLPIMSAVAVAVGIGIQNFPEGAAVSLAMLNTKVSRVKSFNYGQLSGIVEPPAALLGALLAVGIAPAMPFALSFAAGAMIYVVVEELIPGARSSGATGDHATVGAILGFAIMMTLDVALG